MVRLDDGRWCCVWCERIADAGEAVRQLGTPDLVVRSSATACEACAGEGCARCSRPARPPPTRIPGPGRNQSE